MRYEVFAWADAACQAQGALDHPLAPMLTGMRAYGAWVRGEFDLAIQLAQETRHLEDQLSVFPSGLAERTFANVLYIVGDSMRGHAEALRQIELAEESANRSRIVHACYMGAVDTAQTVPTTRPARLSNEPTSWRSKRGRLPIFASAEVAAGFASRAESEALQSFTAGGRIARVLPATAGCTRSPSPRQAGSSFLRVRSRPGVRVSQKWSGSGTAPETGHSNGTRCRAV